MKETKFKQTEVGMIPSDWEVSPIKGLCTKVTDGSHESPKEVDNGYYMPSVKDMTDLGFCFSDCKQISKNDYLKLERNGCRPEKDDVLIAKDGSILKYAFVMDDELPIVILSSIAILRPNKKKIDSHYFAHYFKKEDFVNKVLSDYKTGTGVPRIVLNNFKEIEIAYPKKIEEQQRIANALSDVDSLIANLEKLIAKKKNIKQGAMQQLLTGRKRLPGFALAKSTYKQTELGKIPTDWEVKNVGKLLKIGHGRDYKNLKSGNVPVYGTGGYMTSVNDYLYEGETVCIGRKGTIDKPFYHTGKIWTVDTLFYTYGFNGCIPKFIYYAFCLVDWLAMNEASGVPSLTSKNIEDVLLRIPPSKAEQTAIANVLSDMDTEISALETKLAKYRTLKTGMMQQLLTGKIRLV